MEDTVRKRTADLRTALAEVKAPQQRMYEAHLDTIHRLVLAAEYKDRATMHDVGKLGIPDHILLKPGTLDAAE